MAGRGGTIVKRGRKAETKAMKEARLRFYEGVLATSYLYEDGCWFRGVVAHKCDGPIDPCHIIDKQGLKHLTGALSKPEAMIYDVRNGVPGCRHIHNMFDNFQLRIYQDDLPRSVMYFVTDWEEALAFDGVLQEKLDRKCPRGGAA